MGHYSIRLKVRKHRKEIAARANKNNFKYELSYWRASVDKWHKSTITKVATPEKRKEVLDNFEKHNGGFKQPGYYITDKNNKNRYLIEPMSQMTYLRKLAWHKMDKWDRKNPKPVYPENCTDIDKKTLDETYKKLRADVYSSICTQLLRTINNKRKRSFYSVQVIGQKSDEPFMKHIIWYNNKFDSLKKAKTDFIDKTKKYMTNGSGNFNKDYRRTDLISCVYKNGKLNEKIISYHTIHHPAKEVMMDTYNNFIKNLRLSVAGGKVIPFNPEIAYVA